MRLGIFKHQWVFLFVLYIGADFLDPSIPGVFFLDNDALFMDGVVQKKGSHSARTALPEPAPDHARLTQVVEPRHVPSRSMLGTRTPRRPVQQEFARRSLSPPASARSAEDH